MARKCIEQKEVEERKSYRQLNETLWCVFELSQVLYLCRDCVTDLTKIVTTVTRGYIKSKETYLLITSTTFMDKIKNKQTNRI
jgi:sugar-specific transcriptional regulator TrmB